MSIIAYNIENSGGPYYSFGAFESNCSQVFNFENIENETLWVVDSNSELNLITISNKLSLSFNSSQVEDIASTYLVIQAFGVDGNVANAEIPISNPKNSTSSSGGSSWVMIVLGVLVVLAVVIYYFVKRGADRERFTRGSLIGNEEGQGKYQSIEF